MHSLGLIAGPVLGSVMMVLFGPVGLLAGLLLALSAGLGAVIWAARARAHAGPARRPDRIAANALEWGLTKT
jgi:hypothetical protein